MFCPRCSRPTITAADPRCDGCGLPLGPIARVLGLNTDSPEVQSVTDLSTPAWYQRWDVRLMFFSIVLLPLIVFLAYRFDSPMPFTVPALIFFTGLSSTAYAALFGTAPPQLTQRDSARRLTPRSGGVLPELLLARLTTELAQQDTLSPLVIEGLMLELIAVTSRSVGPVVEPERPAWLDRVDEFLQIHFAEPLTLAELADYGGVHPTHLARGFRQHFGGTVGERIRQLRVEQSCRLLISTETPLSEIALASGFYDQSHFSRCFRELCGISPSVFRAANRAR